MNSASDTTTSGAPRPSDDADAPAPSSCAPTGGLRERKKQQARENMHRAALELVLERGLGGVTAEMISERAGVSARTFFNHWATKEMAILGISLGDADDLAAQFRARPAEESPQQVLRAVLRGAVESSDIGLGMRELRKQVMRKEARLHSMSVGRTADMQAELVEAYQERLASAGGVVAAADGPGGMGDGPGAASGVPGAAADGNLADVVDPPSRAVLAVQLGFGYVRSAFIISMSRGVSALEEYDRLLELKDSGAVFY